MLWHAGAVIESVRLRRLPAWRPHVRRGLHGIAAVVALFATIVVSAGCGSVLGALERRLDPPPADLCCRQFGADDFARLVNAPVITVDSAAGRLAGTTYGVQLLAVATSRELNPAMVSELHWDRTDDDADRPTATEAHHDYDMVLALVSYLGPVRPRRDDAGAEPTPSTVGGKTGGDPEVAVSAAVSRPWLHKPLFDLATAEPGDTVVVVADTRRDGRAVLGLGSCLEFHGPDSCVRTMTVAIDLRTGRVAAGS